MRNDILEQAQEIRTSIDSVTVALADADAAKNPMLFLPSMPWVTADDTMARYTSACRLTPRNQAGNPRLFLLCG